jgi:iron(III) transport system permease protein
MRATFRLVALMPLLAPTMLPAIALVYLFGNQGVAKGALFGATLYGPIGIVLAESIYTFPHATLILATALSLADARLYEAAASLKTSPLRTFLSVTIPATKFGLVSASIVVFTLSVTDFGIPRVVGGQFSVFATDIYVNVVGIRDFETAAVIGTVLLVPALISFFVDWLVKKRQQAVLSARSVPLIPKPQQTRDLVAFIYCLLVCGVILTCFGMAFFASIVTFWPYNLNLTFANYDFSAKTDIGWQAYTNSLVMSGLAAAIGTLFVFSEGYLVEKVRGFRVARTLIHGFAMLPMAVPGVVLGLAYVLFFNQPANPLNCLIGTMTIMVISCIVHFFTVAHLTALTALKQIDSEFESVAASLKLSPFTLVYRVTAPVSLPVILDVSVYLFLTSMTTVSAIVFLYWPQTMTASIQMLFQNDNGDLAGAAALGMMIVFTSLLVRIVHWLMTRKVLTVVQRWRQASPSSRTSRMIG